MAPCHITSPATYLLAPTSVGPESSTTNWANLFGPLLVELDRYFRGVAREEHARLLAEMAAAAEQAIEDDQILTVQQAAELLNIRPQTVYEWIKAHKLKSFVVGNNSIRLRRLDVLAALRAQTQANGQRKYARRRKEVAYA